MSERREHVDSPPEVGHGRAARNRYVLALCGSVALVFGIAGRIVYRGAQDLSDKAEEHLAEELDGLRKATERRLLNLVDELEILAAQPVMLRIYDEDADNEISAALKGLARTSAGLLEIDCLSAETGRTIASTDVERLVADAFAVPARIDEHRSRALVERLDDGGITILVPVDVTFDQPERIGYLRSSVRAAWLLPEHVIEWISILDEGDEVVVERGQRPPDLDRNRSHDRSPGPDRMVVRSAELAIPEAVDAPRMSLWVAKPYDTLFGRSLSLKSKVLWLGGASALVLALVMLTFLRLEGNYNLGLERHALELERKNVDLERSETGLREQTRLAQAASAAKSEFLATMSHELRTPMNGVIGMTGLLAATPLDREQSSLTETIGQCADALLRVINDILDFSEAESGRIELQPVGCAPRAIARNVVEVVAWSAREKSLDLRLTVDPTTPERIVCDPDRLHQVLVNLLVNAVKFTEQGEVELGLAPEGDGADLLRFSVRDTGIGIPRADHERIFEPFSQLDGSHSRRHGGTGLGLASCKRFVEAMGGRIGVTSEHGTGTTVWFTLDAIIGDEEPGRSAEPPLPPKPPARGPAQATHTKRASTVTPGADPTRPRILVAEDNPVNQRLIQRQVEMLGYACTVADNGAIAVEAHRTEDVALVLMDIQMPEMDGLEATRRIRASQDALKRQVPVIAVTANASQEDRERGIAAGMNDYLAKPVPPAVLRDTIAKWLA